MQISKNYRFYFVLFVLFLHSSLFAQTSTSLSMTFMDKGASLTGVSSAFKNAVHIKAIRHFHNKYKNDRKEIWSKISDGYMAQFLNHGIKHRIYYSFKGGWICTIKDYEPAKVPAEIAAVVKISYSNYQITHVSGVESPVGKTQLIHVYYGNQYKILRLVNGEIELLQDYLDIKQ